jgi:pyridoxine kinase
MSHNHQKKVAVVNDYSGFGRCSLAVALPIISAMGMQCCPLPTAIFSNHTGFSSYYWTDFTSHMTAYMDEWEKLGLRFDAISTGFLGSQAQCDIVLDFLRRFKTENTIAVIDPVMGDNGKLYATYSRELAESMRVLTAHADILTPNLTEACLLTRRSYDPNMTERELGRMCEELCGESEKKIVISGLFHGDELGNYVFEAGRTPRMVRERRVGEPRSGTGDVFCAIITGCAVNGVDFVESVERASGFVARSIVRSEELGIPTTDGIAFEELLRELIPQTEC